VEEKNDQVKGRDAYQDFLTDVSSQFEKRDEERDFLDSITQEPDQEDIKVNVGERVRLVREEHNLSLKDVSQRTGLDVSLLEQIENRTVAPPLGTVIKLAKALDMKMGYLISGEENRPYTIVRKHDRKVVSRYDSRKVEYYGYGYEALAPHKKDRHMEPFLVSLDPSETEERSLDKFLPKKKETGTEEFIDTSKDGVAKPAAISASSLYAGSASLSSSRYSGPDGEVYQREGQQWSQYSEGNWNTMHSLEQEYRTPSRPQPKPESQQYQRYVPAHKKTLSRAELDRQELARLEGMDNYAKYRMDKDSEKQ